MSGSITELMLMGVSLGILSIALMSTLTILNLATDLYSSTLSQVVVTQPSAEDYLISEERRGNVVETIYEYSTISACLKHIKGTPWIYSSGVTFTVEKDPTCAYAGTVSISSVEEMSSLSKCIGYCNSVRVISARNTVTGITSIRIILKGGQA